jgi:hypothetical protein
MSIFKFCIYNICIFELSSILLSLSFMIEILQVETNLSSYYYHQVNIVLFYTIYVWYKNYNKHA